MQLINYLLKPQNIIFVIPPLIAFIYLLLLAFGTADPGEAEGEVAVEADADLETDTDLEHAGGEHFVSETHDHDDDLEDGTLIRILSFLNIGKVPLSLYFISFSFIWGTIGLTLNFLINNVTTLTFIQFIISFPLTLLASILFAKFFAQFISKIIPKTETTALSMKDLQGNSGTVQYEITHSFGKVQIYDQNRSFHTINCRLKDGQNPIPPGTAVVLMEYHPDENYFSVITETDFREKLRARRS